LYLEPDLEIRLKLEALRRKKPMSEVIREALRSYFRQKPRTLPPGAGAFDSGHVDTAERAEELLGELGFGEEEN
jgi:hypothetical protein